MENVGGYDLDKGGLPIIRGGKRKRPKFVPHPFDIQPIKTKDDPDAAKPIKGKELIPDLYPGSVALVAKTKSGKTTVIKHLLDHTIDERTSVYIFCSTVDIDEGWIAIVKDLRARRIGVMTWTSMFAGRGLKKVNYLLNLYEMFKREDEVAKRQGKQLKGLHELQTAPSFFGSAATNPVADPENVGLKEAKEYPDQVPKRVVILDDLAIEELHDASVDTSLKKTRHYKARVFISSQHIMHITKTAFAQLSLVCLWKGFSADYIKRLVDGRLTTSLEFKQFYLLYKEVTKEPYTFLTIYQQEDQLRRKFDLPPIPTQEIFYGQ